MEVNQRQEENVPAFKYVSVPVPHDAKEREHIHRAGLLAPGYERRSSNLPEASHKGPWQSSSAMRR